MKNILNSIEIENDMQIKAIADSDNFSRRVFKKCPLLGDHVIGDRNLNTLYANVKKYIDKRMSPEGMLIEKTTIPREFHEQTTLAVINLAKEWNSNEEGKFTRYIAMQFGYKDDYWRVWEIITESLEISLNANHRFFIKRNKERLFYETVMAHSLGPKGSWLPLIDLLFHFYKENLDWKYVHHDPLFVRFVFALQDHFNNESNSDDNFIIASRVYSLRVGIRRLVQERPGFCVSLFEDIVKRIDDLLQNKAESSRRYVYAVTDEWYKNMLSKTENSSVTSYVKRYRGNDSDVALNYSDVSIKYVLEDDGIFISIPSIRLLGDESGDARADLFFGDSNIKTVSLQVLGNELGETIRETKIKLPYEKNTNDEIKLRIQIKRGDSVIYDSGKRLWRSVILFSYGREVDLNRINYLDYQIFAMKCGEISGANITTFDSDDASIMDVYFGEGYMLKYRGKTLAVDSSTIQDMSVSEPQVVEGAYFEHDGNSIYVSAEKPELRVYLPSIDEVKKYRVCINGDEVNSGSLWDEANSCLNICSKMESMETVHFTVFDMSHDRTVFDKTYLYIDEFRYAFNRDCYVNGHELDQGEVKITYNGNTIEDCLNGNKVYKLNLLGGTINIDVPYISCNVEKIGRIYFDKYIWIEDIEADTVLNIHNGTHKKVTVQIGEVRFESFENEIELYKIKNSINNSDDESKNIIIEVGTTKRTVYKILFKNSFVDNPILGVNDNMLWWDGGLSYIGDESAQLSLKMDNGENCYEYTLSLGERVINHFSIDEFVDGEYEWCIYDDEDVIRKGKQFLGDERKVRFKDKIIKIDRIAGEMDDRTSEVDIKDVCIDQIKYVDTSYVETEGDIFDVYTGCMYWNSYSGKRYYSFKYTDRKYKVNPVKIIYISKKYLRIVNEDDEGIYYYNNRYSSNPGIEITDREPTGDYKNYNDILFYLYSVESIEKKQLNTISKSGTINKSEEKTAEIELLDKRLSTDNNKKEELRLFEGTVETSQKRVIEASASNRLLVNAGPGTGKTWTLIEKIIYMVKKLEIDADAVQVLCFSRAAVEVIKKRIKEEIETENDNLDINRIDVRTFDSFATQFLYWIKDSEYDLLLENYQIEALNYDERINKFIEILKKEPGLISECKHLFVDEVQDLVGPRAEMVLTVIRNLPETCGVTLFGDACQAIYDYQLGENGKSLGFYREIKKLNGFSFVSFNQNHRQTSEMMAYSDGYRKYILNEDISGCKEYLESLSGLVTRCKFDDLERFDNAALDFYFSEGTVAILTRNNAQALRISGFLMENGVKHNLQRRLNDLSLDSWISIVFNEMGKNSYDFSEFSDALNKAKVEYIDEIWDFLSDGSCDSRLDTKAMLSKIKKYGNARLLYENNRPERLTVSTIHRSKGREYDTVIVLDDLLQSRSDDIEEHRVKYVALSRAKKALLSASMKKVYSGTLENSRRNFAVVKRNTPHLSRFEVGKEGDLDSYCFASSEGLQKWIRENAERIIGKKVYLNKKANTVSGRIVYDVILEDDNTIIGQTGINFSKDLKKAIRRIKKLPSNAEIYEYLYPSEFRDIYVSSLSSDIAITRGDEQGVIDFGGIVTWNTIQINGYAKAIYN